MSQTPTNVDIFVAALMSAKTNERGAIEWLRAAAAAYEYSIDAFNRGVRHDESLYMDMASDFKDQGVSIPARSTADLIAKSLISIGELEQLDEPVSDFEECFRKNVRGTLLDVIRLVNRTERLDLAALGYERLLPHFAGEAS